jgi:hypothetical protein
MIKAVADIVTDLEVKHTVDLKNQERTILIELHKVGWPRVGIELILECRGYERRAGLLSLRQGESRPNPRIRELISSTTRLPWPSRLLASVMPPTEPRQ